jgi:hypothetical protein
MAGGETHGRDLKFFGGWHNPWAFSLHLVSGYVPRWKLVTRTLISRCSRMRCGESTQSSELVVVGSDRCRIAGVACHVSREYMRLKVEVMSSSGVTRGIATMVLRLRLYEVASDRSSNHMDFAYDSRKLHHEKALLGSACGKTRVFKSGERKR